MSAQRPPQSCADVSSAAAFPLAGRRNQTEGDHGRIVKAFRPNDCTCFKEAVCIDAERIYDGSCSDKDCLEDLQVFFSDKTQPIIDKAASIKCKKVKVINVCVDVASVPFNKGFYSVDMTFYFLVELSAYLSPGTPAVNCCGISYFSKKVILYGSEANARVFSSHSGCCSNNEQMTAMPNAVVQIVDPICSSACRYVECPAKTCCPGSVIPCQICTQVGGKLPGCSGKQRGLYYTWSVYHRSACSVKSR